MDRFHQMEVFVAAAEAGSFAGAGKRLGISPPAVTRAISSLEQRLGGRLFNRTTRSLSLTEAGLRFLESGRRLLTEIDEAEKDVVGEALVPQGHLRITASVTFGRIALAPILSGFLREYPRIDASLMLVDRIVNLVEEGIDAGIRIGRLPDSSLVARRVGKVRRILVASPDYLARQGVPDHPSDLADHRFIGFTGLPPNNEWHFEDEGKKAQVSLRPRMEVNDAATAIAAAQAGDGITNVFCYMVSEQIKSGQLMPVLERYWPEATPVQLVYPQTQLLAAKVRAFIDYAAPPLSTTLGRFDDHSC